MDEHGADLTQRQRLLECWLPLAQQVLADCGIRATPAQLEALVLAAASELTMADSASGARAVLWAQHRRNQKAPQ
ncbi:hypothetical protein SE17_10330 [Kouleothrix aurantiaca]|uniref:Uncharacterized protein n=1 Tax=Kouleothrix aurantiaca TaxID=186479 RepID=A0A0P9DT15_9CHLR|nr:hypothetical protein SE17_10330 [Kouleothrix aurantiaca]